MSKKDLTIVIVTKNRPEMLFRILNSLVSQKNKDFEVIIVDNDNLKSGFVIYKYFLESLNISYYSVIKQGVPFVRNKALEVVKTDYLAFIDDDCVVQRSWVNNAYKIINKFPQFTYFVGCSKLLNFSSKIALAQYAFQEYWHKKKLKGVFVSGSSVDTKNIIFKMSDLRKNKALFDTKIRLGWYDSCDTDLGFYMDSKKLSGLYVEKLIIWHEETQNLLSFFKKSYYRGALSKLIANKWKIENQFVDLSHQSFISYIKSVKNWPKEYKEYKSYFKSINLISFLLIKIYEKISLIGYVQQN